METRDRILDAALHVMRTRGFARTTTKEIARAAGYSEATLYKHFTDKTAIFMGVLHERLPAFWPLVQELVAAESDRSVRDRLTAVAHAAVDFYVESFPISASIFAEPGLVAAQHAAVQAFDAGPHRPVVALAQYLRAEQGRGRVSAAADCDAAAALLIGACFQYAFLCSFEQRQPSAAEIGRYAASVTTTLTTGLGGGT